MPYWCYEFLPIGSNFPQLLPCFGSRKGFRLPFFIYTPCTSNFGVMLLLTPMGENWCKGLKIEIACAATIDRLLPNFTNRFTANIVHFDATPMRNACPMHSMHNCKQSRVRRWKQILILPSCRYSNLSMLGMSMFGRYSITSSIAPIARSGLFMGVFAVLSA